MHGKPLPTRSARVIKLRRPEFDAEMASKGKTSNQDIARLLQCGESTVSRLRNDRHPLSATVIAAVIDALGPEGFVRVIRVCDDDRVAA